MLLSTTLLNASSLTDCFSITPLLSNSLVVVSLLIKSIMFFKSFFTSSEYFLNLSLLSIYSLVILWKILCFSILLVLKNFSVFNLVIYPLLVSCFLKYSLSWIWTPKYNCAPLFDPGLRISTSKSFFHDSSQPSHLKFITISSVGAPSRPSHNFLLKSILVPLFLIIL